MVNLCNLHEKLCNGGKSLFRVTVVVCYTITRVRFWNRFVRTGCRVGVDDDGGGCEGNSA